MNLKVNQLDLGFGTVKLVTNKNKKELGVIYDRPGTTELCGLCDHSNMIIYIAKDQTDHAKYQTLVHEICEMLVKNCEIKYSHTLVLLIESMLSAILNNNRSVIRGYWKIKDSGTNN